LNIGVATASRMGYEDRQYHRQRQEQCRMMAELARNPDIRRRHEGLAGCTPPAPDAVTQAQARL